MKMNKLWILLLVVLIASIYLSNRHAVAFISSSNGGSVASTPGPTGTATPTPGPTIAIMSGSIMPNGTVANAHDQNPLAANLGGVATMTGAPMWARYFGNGADGAGPASGSLNFSGEKNFTSWTCTGAITMSAGNVGIVVRSQGTVALNTGCTLTTSAATSSSSVNGQLGGAGGSGGSGAANSAAAKNTGGVQDNVANNVINLAYSTGGGASSAGAGNDGSAITNVLEQFAFSHGPAFGTEGGTTGSAGGSAGGAAGNGGTPIIIIAPTITIASGVILDSSGTAGTAAAANSTGGGGGGGGGNIWFLSESFTDNGAIYRAGGGPGGACTAPSIQATGGGCTTAGCGTDAFFTVTSLSGGGLSAGGITITNAGSGYQVAPVCKVNAGASGLTGSPACHFTLSGNTIGSVVIDTAGSGGTLSTFTTCFVGGYGANGRIEQRLIQ